MGKFFDAAKIIKFLLVICGFFCLSIFPKSNAFAKVEISIRGDFSRKAKILVSGLENNNFLIRRDVEFFSYKLLSLLDTTALFEFIPESQFIRSLDLLEEKPASSTSENILSADGNPVSKLSSLPFNLRRELAIGEVPYFEVYQKKQIDNIAIFSFSLNSAGNIEIHLKIWDVGSRKEILAKSIISTRINIGEAAKEIANQLYVALSGEEKGHFKSQIAYISETGSIRKRIKKLCLIEIDGSNRNCLTDGKDIVLTPIFSKDPNEIFYVRYFRGQPQIFKIEANSKRSQKIGGYQESTMAPAVHPFNQDILLLSAFDDGDSDIHLLDTGKNFARKITNSSAIDTTASFSPDAKTIIFTSDRKNGQQIYRMNLDGSDLKRISHGGGNYAKPQFSPDGRFIAFTKIYGDKFSIGVMNEDGSNEKILASSYIAEGARWSNNGRYLIYSKKAAAYGKNSIPRLLVVDVFSGSEYEVPTPKNEGAVDPDWSW